MILLERWLQCQLLISVCTSSGFFSTVVAAACGSTATTFVVLTEVTGSLSAFDPELTTTMSLVSESALARLNGVTVANLLAGSWPAAFKTTTAQLPSRHTARRAAFDMFEHQRLITHQARRIPAK